MIVAITGASGSMGKETLKSVMELANVSLVRILLLDEAKEHRFARKVKNEYKNKIEIIYGDVRNYEDCLKFTKHTDYVLHLAAVIPPKADHFEELAIGTNYHGTCNIVNAIIENGNTAKLIHISTVALYGNRDKQHPWGRVGDPLITSAFDVYGTSKLRGERYLLESNIKNWAILRQTGILYDNMLMNNISDGLMFHTPWNVPIEWVTARDSGILMKNIIDLDMKNKCESFWKNVYNLGGGAKCRETGYETFDNGFKLIGGSVKQFFNPDWNADRNFHCFWFSDSDKLEEMFKFRTEGTTDFWNWFSSRHKIYKAGRIVPAGIIKGLVIKPLLKNNNAPMYWKKHNLTPRVYAITGDKTIPTTWDKYDLWCEQEDYNSYKEYSSKFDLNHGYDESKKVLNILDLKEAAHFRGGDILEESFDGDMYKKLNWSCSENHRFKSSCYTILKAGHWCPECAMPDKMWQFDMLAKKSEFYAQIWYDTHDKNENKRYIETDNGAEMEEI